MKEDTLIPIKLGEKEKLDMEVIIDLLEDAMRDDFRDEIVKRGENYFKNGNVQKVFREGNRFIAKVEGTRHEPYEVDIVFDDFGEFVKYGCDCPCTYQCKHEYAVMASIVNGMFKEVELMPQIEEQGKTLMDLVNEIPAKELKEYLLSDVGQSYVKFEINAFLDYFWKYHPKQGYEFYYNNLYNEIVLEEDYYALIDYYLDLIKRHFDVQEFEEPFIILKAIIEACHSAGVLSESNYLLRLFPMLGMYLRIIYRKGNKELKKQIDEWVKEVEKEKYYNCYYLEDIMLSFK